MNFKIKGVAYIKVVILTKYLALWLIKIPTLLIVEDIVPIDTNFNHPLITFSRNNPEKAINKLKNEMSKMESKKEGGSNVAAWLIGGAAILGLIALLSGDSKK